MPPGRSPHYETAPPAGLITLGLGPGILPPRAHGIWRGGSSGVFVLCDCTAVGGWGGHSCQKHYSNGGLGSAQQSSQMVMRVGVGAGPAPSAAR